MSDPLSDLRLAALISTLRSCQLFAGLRADDLRAVANLVTVRSLSKGQYLFHEGEPAVGFYLVQKGAINVHRVNAAGKEQVIHVFRAGETFAEAALASEKGYPADARAVEASQLLQIQKAGFVDLLKRHPEVALRLLASMSAHLRVVVSQLEDLTLKDVETRLIHWLLKQCPPGESAPVTIELRGTKRSLAAELGTVSETFSRSLAKLRDQQLLEVKGNTLTVLAPQQLRALLERHLRQ